MDVALRCRCGNVEVCLREPPNEVAVQPQSLPRVLQRRQRLGIADLTSALHRVPELVRASEHHASDASAKWRCYECRLCHVDTVYACRVESQRQGVTSPSSSEQIVTEGALVNLEFVDVPLPGEQDGYSPAFKIVLPGAHQSQHRPSTDISKLLGAAGAQGLSLFERLTNEVDNWFAQHLRDLAANDRGVTKEQERSIRKNALRDRDAIFVKICQENGIGGDLASLARVAETLATAITKKDLLADDDMDDDYDFEGKCKDLSEFKERHGHCRVPRGWKENVDLSNWVRNLRRKKIRGTLTSDKIAKLEEMGFVWRKERKDSWEEHFAQLVEFNARFGHCRVSRNWKENVKLGQWVQSLRRLKLSGRLSGDKIARLESIGFEWRLRQKEDGLGQDSRDGEQAEASDDGDSDDGDSDPDDAYSDEDFVETDSSQTKKETLAARWFKDADQALSISKTQPQRKALAHHFDGVRLDGLVNFKSSMATPITTPATTSKTSTSTATATTTAAMRIKKAKARLPRSPTFSLNDIDEDLYDSYGHGKYYDYEDEDDEEFDAALDDDEEEDDDWADRAKSTSRSKRKRVREKRPKARQRSNSDEQRPTSPPGPKSGVRACVECGATKTPHWRRGPSDKHGDPAFLCNACGLRYYKTLQQKSSTSTKKKKRLSAKKQKTRRESEAEEEEEEETAPISQEIKKGTTTRSTKKKNKKVTTKPEKSTQKTIVEAVTDSDSESREGLIIDGLTRSHPGEGDKQRSADERALTQEERAEAAEMMVQAAGGENTHVPWLLAFNLQKRKDLVAAAGSDEPTTDANQRDAAAAEAAPAKEEDDEIFDFVE